MPPGASAPPAAVGGSSACNACMHVIEQKEAGSRQSQAARATQRPSEGGRGREE